MNATKAALRPLGGQEQMFAAYSEHGAMFFSIVAAIEGNVSERSLQAAIEVVTRRHPLLRVCLGLDERGISSFIPTHAPVSISFSQSDVSNWETTAASELGNPINPSVGPLVRIRALAHGATTTLIASFHHSAVDGMSAILVLRDLLSALGGVALENSEAPNSIDVMQGLAAYDFRNRVSPLPNSGSRNVVVSSLEFEMEEAQRLLEVCRRNGTTVNSMIAVALARSHFSISHGTDDTFRLMSPLDMRPLLGITDQVGLAISVAMTSFERGEKDFWAAARAFREHVHGQRSLESAGALLTRISPALAADASMETSANRLHTTPWDGIMSNLGAVSIPAHYGDIVLKAIWGPVLRSVPGQDVIGVASFRGTLRLVHTIDGESNRLLKEIEHVLRGLL